MEMVKSSLHNPARHAPQADVGAKYVSKKCNCCLESSENIFEWLFNLTVKILHY